MLNSRMGLVATEWTMQIWAISVIEEGPLDSCDGGLQVISLVLQWGH